MVILIISHESGVIIITNCKKVNLIDINEQVAGDDHNVFRHQTAMNKTERVGSPQVFLVGERDDVLN